MSELGGKSQRARERELYRKIFINKMNDLLSETFAFLRN